MLYRSSRFAIPWVPAFKIIFAVRALVSVSGARAENVLDEFSVARGGDFIMVPILVGAERYQFVLDTGSTCSVFSRRHEAMLGAPTRTSNGRVPGGQRRLQQFAAPPMSLGNIALQTADEVVCDDLSRFERGTVCAIDGILGMDALRHLVVNIDFDDGKVRILKSASGAPGTAVPIIWHQRIRMREGPFIPVKIGAVRHDFLIDSGNLWPTLGTMDTNAFDAHVAHGTMVPLRSRYESVSSGGRSVAALARAPSIEVAGFKHENVIMGRDDFWNNLGVAFLARYVVTFDFPNSVVYLKPGKEFAAPDRLDTSGINMTRQRNELVVASVKYDAPGAIAGVRRGDLILQIDGDLTTGWSLYRAHRVFARPGKHTLVVRWEDREHTLRMIIPDELAVEQGEPPDERP